MADNFVDAEELVVGVGLVADNTAATVEAGEPMHYGSGLGITSTSHTLWYKFTSQVDGFAYLELPTMVGGQWAMVAAYEGAVSASAPGTRVYAVYFLYRHRIPVSAGVEYHVVVAAFNGSARGSRTITLTAVESHPANDAWADAQILSRCMGSLEGSNLHGTVEAPFERGSDTDSYTSVWYKFRAPFDGRLVVNCVGEPDADERDLSLTMFVMNEGGVDIDDLVRVQHVWDSGNGDPDFDEEAWSTQVSVDVESGTDYWLRVGNRNSGFSPGGVFTLLWTMPPRIPDGEGYLATDGERYAVVNSAQFGLFSPELVGWLGGDTFTWARLHFYEDPFDHPFGGGGVDTNGDIYQCVDTDGPIIRRTRSARLLDTGSLARSYTPMGTPDGTLSLAPWASEYEYAAVILFRDDCVWTTGDGPFVRKWSREGTLLQTFSWSSTLGTPYVADFRPGTRKLVYVPAGSIKAVREIDLDTMVSTTLMEVHPEAVEANTFGSIRDLRILSDGRIVLHYTSRRSAFNPNALFFAYNVQRQFLQVWDATMTELENEVLLAPRDKPPVFYFNNGMAIEPGDQYAWVADTMPNDDHPIVVTPTDYGYAQVFRHDLWTSSANAGTDVYRLTNPNWGLAPGSFTQRLPLDARTFDTSTDQWRTSPTSVPSAISRVSSPGPVWGSFVMRYVTASNHNSLLYPATTPVPVAANEWVLFVAWLWTDTAGLRGRPTVVFQNSSGGQVGSTTISLVALRSDGWTRVAVFVRAPAGTARAQLFFTFTAAASTSAPPVGSVFYVSNASFVTMASVVGAAPVASGATVPMFEYPYYERGNLGENPNVYFVPVSLLVNDYRRCGPRETVEGVVGPVAADRSGRRMVSGAAQEVGATVYSGLFGEHAASSSTVEVGPARVTRTGN